MRFSIPREASPPPAHRSRACPRLACTCAHSIDDGEDARTLVAPSSSENSLPPLPPLLKETPASPTSTTAASSPLSTGSSRRDPQSLCETRVTNSNLLLKPLDARNNPARVITDEGCTSPAPNFVQPDKTIGIRYFPAAYRKPENVTVATCDLMRPGRTQFVFQLIF